MTVLGPPDTLYEGGFFNAVLKFPRDYPQHPPDMRFTSEMWCAAWGPLGAGCVNTRKSGGCRVLLVDVCSAWLKYVV